MDKEQFMTKEQFLIEECNKIGVQLNDLQVSQFIRFYELLVEWNSFMNLTGITEYEEVVMKHFVDSLALVNLPKLITGKPKVIDMGTGAGFPGLPLKIAFPEMEVVLADSLNKRVKFLNEVISQLGLTEITAVHGRAETLGKKVEYREQFDLCVSRAVANMAVLAEYCLPFVRTGGSFVPYKSGAVEEELNQAKHAIHLLGGKTKECKYFCLPDTDIQRAIIQIHKVSNTPKKYPRSEGKPSKEPLA